MIGKTLAHDEIRSRLGKGSVERLDAPCPPNLLRLSVCIEVCGNLIADLDAALKASWPASQSPGA